jgi:hypothetical protein
LGESSLASTLRIPFFYFERLYRKSKRSSFLLFSKFKKSPDGLLLGLLFALIICLGSTTKNLAITTDLLSKRGIFLARGKLVCSSRLRNCGRWLGEQAKAEVKRMAGGRRRSGVLRCRGFGSGLWKWSKCGRIWRTC